MSPVTHDGYQAYLWKWTNYFGGWQQRWFILKDGTLTYYKDANTTDTGCRGSFKLEACNILVHPVDVLRFDILTSTQRIYLRANSKPGRQKWIIHLGSTKANISEEMPDVTTVTLSSFNEHKCELRTIRALLSDKVDELYTMCNTVEPDAEQMKLCRTMINELCEEFSKTLDACTLNVTGDDQDTSTPLIRRCFSHNTSGEDHLPALSLGSYNPPNSNSDTDSSLFTNGSSDISTPQVLGSKRAEKLPCTYFTGIADRFEDLFLRPDAIPSVAFLDACVPVPKLLLTVGGKAVLPLSLDMSNNIQKIKTKLNLHPSKSDTLQAMVHLEIATGTTLAKHSSCTALLWLYRELNFVKELLLAVANPSSQSDMSPLFLEAYERSLKSHHNLMSRSMYTVAAKTIPYREDILRALGHDGMDNTDHAVLTDMKTYATAIGHLTQFVERFYINNRLLS